MFLNFLGNLVINSRRNWLQIKPVEKLNDKEFQNIFLKMSQKLQRSEIDRERERDEKRERERKKKYLYGKNV